MDLSELQILAVTVARMSAAPPRSRVPVADRFRGKVALVTGATHGIGLAIALELLREGATVVASGLPRDAEEGAAAFAAAGFSPPIICGDLGTTSFCEELVAAAAAHGGGRVDCLVNNAFSFISKGLSATAADFERCNAVGPVAFALLIQLCTPLMRAVGGGAIVNVSSISSWVAQPDRWTYNMGGLLAGRQGAFAAGTRHRRPTLLYALSHIPIRSQGGGDDVSGARECRCAGLSSPLRCVQANTLRRHGPRHVGHPRQLGVSGVDMDARGVQGSRCGASGRRLGAVSSRPAPRRWRPGTLRARLGPLPHAPQVCRHY